MRKPLRGARLVTAVTGALAMLLHGCGVSDTVVDSGGDAGTSGTQTTDAGASPRRLCDGSSGVRFAFQLMPGLGNRGEGVTLLVQNGHNYLFVDGQCRYWVYGTSTMLNSWQESRTGTLDESDEAALAAAVSFSHWTSAQGFYPNCDGAFMVFWGDSVVRVLAQGCGSAPSGAYTEIRGEAKAAGEWIDMLWSRGKAVDGPVRLRVVRQPPDATDLYVVQTAAWPLAVSVESLAIELIDDLALGIDDPGYMLNDGDKIAILRGYRDSLLAGQYFKHDWASAWIPIESKGKSFHLYFRDVLPIEDPNGLIRMPESN